MRCSLARSEHTHGQSRTCVLCPKQQRCTETIRTFKPRHYDSICQVPNAISSIMPHLFPRRLPMETTMRNQDFRDMPEYRAATGFPLDGDTAFDFRHRRLPRRWRRAHRKLPSAPGARLCSACRSGGAESNIETAIMNLEHRGAYCRRDAPIVVFTVDALSADAAATVPSAIPRARRRLPRKT